MMKVHLKLLLCIFLHFSAYAGGDSEEGRMHHAQRLSVDPSRTELHDTTSDLPRSVSFDPSARHRDNKGNDDYIAPETDSFHDAQPPATPKKGPAFSLRKPARAHSTASRITHLSHRFMRLFGHPLGGRVNTPTPTPTPTPTTAEPPQRQPSTQHQTPTVTVVEEEPYTEIPLCHTSQVKIGPDLWAQIFFSESTNGDPFTAIVTDGELRSPMNLPNYLKMCIKGLIIRSMDRQPSPGPISIEAFPYLVQFSARGVPIHPNDLITIFEGLPNTIRQLDLTGVGLGNDINAVLALSHYLKSLPRAKMTALGLASNGLTTEHGEIMAPYFANCVGLKTLDLSSNSFTPETSKVFIENLPKGLREFYYDRNPVSNEARAILGKRLDNRELCALQVLSLPETNTHEPIPETNTHEPIPETNTHEPKSGCPASYSPNLRKLDVSFSMGPEGVENLSARMLRNTELSQLQVLDLTGNQMGHTGAIALSKALPYLNVLQNLLLGDNNLGDKGAALVIRSLLGWDLTHEFPPQARLMFQTLVLNRNEISNHIIPLIEALLENVPTLEKLYLEGNPIERQKISSFKRATDPSL